MLRSRLHSLLLAVPLALIGLPALAQDAAPAQPPATAAPAAAAPARPARQGGGRNRLTLASVPVSVMDKKLKLTDDQKTKIGAVQTQYTTDSKALQPAPGTPPDPDARQKMTDLSAKATKDIEDILTPEQKPKAAELLRTLTGYNTLGLPPAVLPDLKLTDDQMKKLDDLATDTQAKMREARQSNAGPEATRTLTETARGKALDLMTPEQKATLEAYQKAHPARGRRQPQ